MYFRFAFNGYAIRFSPFEEGRIAVATAQNFGIIGNGRQYVLQVCIPDIPPPPLAPHLARYPRHDSSATCMHVTKARYTLGRSHKRRDIFHCADYPERTAGGCGV